MRILILLFLLCTLVQAKAEPDLINFVSELDTILRDTNHCMNMNTESCYKCSKVQEVSYQTFTSEIKDEEQLKLWMCKASADPDTFIKAYEQMKVVEKYTGVPAIYMACLSWQETMGFKDFDASSSKGKNYYKGLGHFDQKTISSIKNYINDNEYFSKASKGQFTSFLKEIGLTETQFWSSDYTRKTDIPKTLQTKGTEQALAVQSALIALNTRRILDGYGFALREKDENGKDKYFPMSENHTEAVKYIDQLKEPENAMMSLLLLSAYGHNRGPAAIVSDIPADAFNPSSLEWIEYLGVPYNEDGSIKESTNKLNGRAIGAAYVKNIYSCMAKDTYHPVIRCGFVDSKKQREDKIVQPNENIWKCKREELNGKNCGEAEEALSE